MRIIGTVPPAAMVAVVLMVAVVAADTKNSVRRQPKPSAEKVVSSSSKVGSNPADLPGTVLSKASTRNDFNAADLPQAPDMEFIKQRVTRFVEELQMDSKTGDELIRIAEDIGINPRYRPEEDDLTIDQRDRLRRTMENLVQNIPSSTWDRPMKAPGKTTTGEADGFVYLKHALFDEEDSGPNQNCTTPTTTRYTLINTCQPVAAKDKYHDNLWAMATCDDEGAALTHFDTPTCKDHQEMYHAGPSSEGGKAIVLGFGDCYHGMVRYDECTTTIPKQPNRKDQVVVELFFNKNTCEIKGKPAPEVWVMDIDRQNNKFMCGDVNGTFAWQACKAGGCHTIAGGNTGECVHVHVPENVGVPPYVAARVTGCNY